MPRKRPMVYADGTPVPKNIMAEKRGGRFFINQGGTEIPVLLAEAFRARQLKYRDGRDVLVTPIREVGRRHFAPDPKYGNKEVEVFTTAQLWQRKWKYPDGRDVPETIVMREEGRRRFAPDPLYGNEEVEIFTAGQLSQQKLKYPDGSDVPAGTLIRKEGRRRFATDPKNEDKELEVFFAYQFSQLRFQFPDRRDVPTEMGILHEDNKHYVIIDGEKIEVYTARLLASRRHDEKTRAASEGVAIQPPIDGSYFIGENDATSGLSEPSLNDSDKRERPPESASPHDNKRLRGDEEDVSLICELGFFGSLAKHFSAEAYDRLVLTGVAALDDSGLELLKDLSYPFGQ